MKLLQNNASVRGSYSNIDMVVQKCQKSYQMNQRESWRFGIKRGVGVCKYLWGAYDPNDAKL